MYALTYCYEGVDDSSPYANTIAVSENKELLKQKMMQCVEKDMRNPDPENDEDEWNEDCNWMMFMGGIERVMLQHKARINLYGTYEIHSVNVL